MRLKGPGVAPGWQMPNPRVTQKLLKCPIPGRGANALQLSDGMGAAGID